MSGAEMTQQVNLYLPEFRPRRDWLQPGRMLGLMLALVLLLGLVAAYQYWHRYTVQEALAAMQLEADQQARVTEQIESSLAGRATDQRLLTEISARETSLAQLNGTLSTLRAMGDGNLTGFSEHLKNLSLASFEGLWLTDIIISAGGRHARLQGLALESYMVPNFVDRLSAGWTASEGWRFTRLSGEMAVDDPVVPGSYRFILETQ
jgi:hypothetical protein